jgi:probable rRNA maturation factor
MLRARMAVSMHNQLSSAASRQLARELGLRAKRMLRALGLQEAELSIVLCGDAAMRSLNARFRAIDKSTDVLAFAQGESMAVPTARTRVLGDIVLSLPTAARQARQKGRALLDETTMLLAHGLLHLLGIDHRTRTEWRRMQARTDLLRMAAFGPARAVGNARKVRSASR